MKGRVLYIYTSNPGNGNATQFRIRETKKESTTKTLFQHVFRLFTTNKTDDGAT